MKTQSDYWKNQDILVTGAAGFVGTRLVDILIRLGARVSVLIQDVDIALPFYRESYQACLAHNVERAVVGDLRDYETCERAIVEVWPSYIFHLAAITQVVDARAMPLQAFGSNIMGTANLLEAARRLAPGKIRTVVASSDKAYGEPTEVPLNELSPLNPIHPYDVSKASADFVSRCYALFYGEKVAITRCGNIYGPGDINWQRLIPGAIRAALGGETLLIRSDGKQVREYNYVDDIVNAYLLIGSSLDFEIYNGRSWTISDNDVVLSVMSVVEEIEEILDIAIPFEILGIATDESKELRLDSSSAYRNLNWRPHTSLNEGIKETAKWMQQYLFCRGQIPREVI